MVDWSHSIAICPVSNVSRTQGAAIFHDFGVLHVVLVPSSHRCLDPYKNKLGSLEGKTIGIVYVYLNIHIYIYIHIKYFIYTYETHIIYKFRSSVYINPHQKLWLSRG